MAGDGTIVLALEGQLRLDDQPALHQAVDLSRRTPGGRLLVLASRPEGQRLRGPHQRRLAAQALASLRTRLAAANVPLLAFPQHTTAAALAALSSEVTPTAVLTCAESRLFADWPIPPERFPRVFADFRRALERAPEPPLPPPDLACPPAPEPMGAAAGRDPRSAFPFSGDEPTALARLQHYVFDRGGLRSYKASRNGLVGT